MRRSISVAALMLIACGGDPTVASRGLSVGDGGVGGFGGTVTVPGSGGSLGGLGGLGSLGGEQPDPGGYTRLGSPEDRGHAPESPSGQAPSPRGLSACGYVCDVVDRCGGRTGPETCGLCPVADVPVPVDCMEALTVVTRCVSALNCETIRTVDLLVAVNVCSGGDPSITRCFPRR